MKKLLDAIVKGALQVKNFLAAIIKGALQNKKLFITIIAVSVLVVSTIVGVSVYANSPKVIVRNSIGNAFDDLLERDEVEPIIKMLEKGSLELSVTSDMEDMKGELGGKIYFSDDEVYFENLFVETDNIEISADAYLGTDYMYVSNDQILDGTYGIVRGKLAEGLKNSIFAFGSNSEYAIPEEEYNKILEVLSDIDGEIDKDFEKDYEKLVKKYSKLLIKTLEKHAEYEKERDDVKLGGEFRRARIVTVSIDEKALANIIKDIYDKVEDDDDLKDFVIKYGEYVLSFMDPEDISEDFNIEDGYDELLDKIENYIDENLSKDNIENAIGDFKVEIDVVTAKSSSKLLQLSVTVKSEGAKQEIFTLDFGKKGVAKTDIISLDILDGMYVVTYEVTEDSSKEYISKVTVSTSMGMYGADDEYKYEIFRIAIDKKDDEFKLIIPLEEGDDDDIVIRGDFIGKSRKTTVVINKIEVGDEVFDDFEIKIVIDEKDSMPKPIKKNKITSIFDLTEKDIENIIGKAEDKFENIGGFEGMPFPDNSDDSDIGFDW